MAQIWDGAGESRTVQNYPDNWRQVKLLASLDIEYSPNADKWLGYNPTPGSCPLTGGSTEKVGSITAGDYTVLASRTYDGIENPKNVRPIEFYQLNHHQGQFGFQPIIALANVLIVENLHQVNLSWAWATSQKSQDWLVVEM